MSSSITQAKRLLRREIKQRLNQLSEDEKKSQSAAITRKVFASDVYGKSNRVSIYLPMKDEVNTIPILKDMLKSGKQCFIPHYEGSSMAMVCLASWEEYEKLPENSWGIKQPQHFDPSQDALKSGGLDLIFMPGLAFTSQGVRLGRGKGYYDKYLQNCREQGDMPKTIALAFREQIVSFIPTTDHDMSIEAVISPSAEASDL